MKQQNMLIILGIAAIIAIIGLVLLFQSVLTGEVYYRTPDEACASYTMMCEDGLSPLFTGNIDYRANVVECRCQTNPYRTGWRSLILEYGKVL